MQTRQQAVRAARMHREEEDAAGWRYTYASQPGAGPSGQLAAVTATRYRPSVAYLSVHVAPDDDGWSDETLSVADFIARVKAVLAEAITGAL